MNVCLRCLKQESKRELMECGHVNIFTVTAAIIWTIRRFFLSFGLHDIEEKICSLHFSCFSKAAVHTDCGSVGSMKTNILLDPSAHRPDEKQALPTLVVLQVFPRSSALLDLLQTIISDLSSGHRTFDLSAPRVWVTSECPSWLIMVICSPQSC